MLQLGILLAGLAPLIEPARAWSWSPPINLTRLGDGADAGGAVIAVDAEGHIHLLVSRAGQQIWSLRVEEDVRADFSPLTTGTSPAIAADKVGRVHAVWSQGWEIQYRQWDAEWGPADSMISNGSGESVGPSIRVDEQNNVHVAWARADTVWYNRRSADTGQWDGPQQIPGADDLQGHFPPRVSAVGAAPVVIYGRHNGGNWTAWLASRETGSWTHTLLDSNPGTSNGSIDVGPDGTIEAAWDRGYDIWHRRRTAGMWEPLTLIRGGAASSLGPRISAVPAGKVDIVWSDNGGGLNDIWTSRWNGTAWTPPGSVTGQSGGVAPAIARDPAGGQHVVWSQGWDIWLARDRPDASPPPAPEDLGASPRSLKVALHWTHPKAIDLAAVRIVFRTDRPPHHPADGSIILDKPADWGADAFTHLGLTNGTKYHYGVFLRDAAGNFSPPSVITATPAVQPDFDRDGDVDQEDFGRFQRCLAGPAATPPPGCQAADLDGDGDVDQDDWGIFFNCFSGPGVYADPACAEI